MFRSEPCVDDLTGEVESLLAGEVLPPRVYERGYDPSVPYSILGEWERHVEDRVANVVGLGCAGQVRGVVNDILEHDPYTRREWNPRLFALAVLGCVSDNPTLALDVSAVSRLWWAGAEALDDLTDGGAAPNGIGYASSPGALLIGAIVATTLLPQLVVEDSFVPDEVRRSWRQEVLVGSLAASDGQMADLAEHAPLTWKDVMACYVGKTGAPYGRDATMAVRLITKDVTPLCGWRAFGRLFGVLRQVRNDNLDVQRSLDHDLANGTPTLWLAHAIESDSTVDWWTLRAAARRDDSARAELARLMMATSVKSGYAARVRVLATHAHVLLDSLSTQESLYRDVVHRMIDEATERAIAA